MFVETDQHRRTTGHAGTAHVEGLTLDVKLVQKAGIPYGCLRITDQHGGAGSGLRAAHYPGVTELGIRILRTRGPACGQSVLAHPGVHLFDPLFGYVFPPYDGGLIINDDSWCAPPQRRRGQGRRVAQAVLAEELGEVPPGKHTVGRRPGFALQIGLLKKIVLGARVLGKVVVYSRAVSLEQAQCLLIQVLHHTLGPLGKAEHAHDTVVLQSRLRAGPAGPLLVLLTEDLGHAPLHHTQEVIHLVPSILCTGVPQPVHGTFIRLRKDMGHAPRIPEQLHPTVPGHRRSMGDRSRHQQAQDHEEQRTSFRRGLLHNVNSYVSVLLTSASDLHAAGPSVD